MPAKCVLTILQLYWYQRFGYKTEKKKNANLSSSTYAVHASTKQIISRRVKNENGYEMHENEYRTSKACKDCCFSLLNLQICGVHVAVVAVLA